MSSVDILIIKALLATIHICCVGIGIIYCYKAADKGEDYVKILAIIIFLGFTLGIVRHYILGGYLGLPYPYKTFLFAPGDRFNDFFNTLNACRNNNPYLSTYWLKSPYFPIANSIYYIFGLFRSERVSLAMYMALFFIVYLLYIKRSLFTDINQGNIMDFLIIALFSYPFLFNVDRANLDMYLFLFLLGFFEFFKRKRYKMASGFLSVAVAMKLYPGVFFFFS